MSKQQARMMGFALLFSFAALRAMAGEAPDSTFPKPQTVPGSLKPTVGVLGGYADQNGTVKGAFAYGAEVAIQPVVPFSLAIQYIRFHASQENTATQTDPYFERNELMARAAYNFGGTNPILSKTYVGGMAGVVFDKNGSTVGGTEFSDTRTRFAFAPVIGMDFMLNPMWSVGAQLSYIFTVGPEKPYNTAQALASVKYWF